MDNKEKSEAISCSDDKWAVFLIERPFRGKENIVERVTEFIGVFNEKMEAFEFIGKQHVKGNRYFITQGCYVGPFYGCSYE